MTKCITCGKDLSNVSEIHALYGLLFCSETCTMSHISETNEYVDAVRLYREVAEVVTPQDIGLKEDTDNE